MDSIAEYCYEVTASSDGETVVLKGTLNVINTTCNTGNSTLKANFILIFIVYTLHIIL